jgi:hypothetical protein
MKDPFRVLLLVLETGRRRRLAELCRAASPTVHCVETDDDNGAVFGAALDRLDLIVLDEALLERNGAAWLTNWRRLAPKGDLLVLDADPEIEAGNLRKALNRGLQRA